MLLVTEAYQLCKYLISKSDLVILIRFWTIGESPLLTMTRRTLLRLPQSRRRSEPAFLRSMAGKLSTSEYANMLEALQCRGRLNNALMALLYCMCRALYISIDLGASVVRTSDGNCSFA